MVKARCPHCGGSLDVCIASGEIRRITLASGAVATLGVARNCAKKASRLTADPEAVRLIMSGLECLERADAAIQESLEEGEQ